jgi:hypothetical protein
VLARGQRTGLPLVVYRADELGRVREGRVGQPDQGAADQASRLAAGYGMAQVLDHPVADHVLGLHAQHVERVGPGDPPHHRDVRMFLRLAGHQVWLRSHST